VESFLCKIHPVILFLFNLIFRLVLVTFLHAGLVKKTLINIENIWNGCLHGARFYRGLRRQGLWFCGSWD